MYLRLLQMHIQHNIKRTGFFLFILLFICPQRSIAQLSVTDNQNALTLAQNLAGAGVVVLNPVLTCAGISNALFEVNGTSNLGIGQGIILTSGIAKTNGVLRGVDGPQVDEGPNDGGLAYTPGDPDLDNVIPGVTSNNACVLQFDFVPAGDSIKFDYVFASSEYQDFSCNDFNDVFGFFISGPGYASTYNMAKIPGTTIPICVNSTTNPALNLTPANTANCTAMGQGSPFSQYYVDNVGGTSITFRGFTTVFTAAADVNPCDTYHLKLAIGDGYYNPNLPGAIDEILDSGVFLKAGSLSSSGFQVKATGGAGLETPFANTVRGCPPGTVRVSRTGDLTLPVTVPVQYTGTAISGTDYLPLPGSVVIPAGDSFVTFQVEAIPLSAAAGPKSVIINLLAPLVCNGNPVIVSKDTLMIYDSIYIKILTPDTVICKGNSVTIMVEADDILTFNWTPAASVNNPNVKNIVVTPTGPATYKLTGSITSVTGSGCAPSSDQVFIDVKEQPLVNAGPDTVSCGTGIQLNTLTHPFNPDETFSWTPANGLSDPAAPNPFADPESNTTYVVKVNPGAAGCDGYDTVHVAVIQFKQDLGDDLVFCKGVPINVQLTANIPAGGSASWSTGSKGTHILVDKSGNYWVTVKHPSCPEERDSIKISIDNVCGCFFEMPNAFSPNNDGINDELSPFIEKGCIIRNYSIHIYNRYGQLVYEGRDPNRGWDGNSNGVTAIADVYMYEVKFQGGPREIQYYKKGDVTLLR
jgi:gliding motility-associated-like protein